MMDFGMTKSEIGFFELQKIGGLWVVTHKPRGHWVRAGLKNVKMGIFLVAHGASHSIECPPPGSMSETGKLDRDGKTHKFSLC